MIFYIYHIPGPEKGLQLILICYNINLNLLYLFFSGEYGIGRYKNHAERPAHYNW